MSGAHFNENGGLPFSRRARCHKDHNMNCIYHGVQIIVPDGKVKAQ